jgi:hypothetical protein
MQRATRAADDFFCAACAPVPYSWVPVSTGGAPCDDPRVWRGGFWNNNRDNARATYRNHNDPHNRNDNVGLRVVRSSHIVIPLLTAQPGLYDVAWLLRACPPALLARGTLPELAADHGLRPEAKGIRMAQVSPARTDVAQHKSVGPTHKRGVSWAYALRRLTWLLSTLPASGLARPPWC